MKQKPTAQGIASMAVLATFQQKCWSASASDPELAAAGAAATGVNPDRARGNKDLIDKRNPLYVAVRRVIKRAYDLHREYTVPWIVTGQDLLATAILPEYEGKMAQLTAEKDAAVAELQRAWPSIVAEGSFHSGVPVDEYPSAEELADKFTFSTVPGAVQTGADLSRVKGMSREVFERLEKAANAAAELGVAGAHRETLRRAHDTVAHLAKKIAEQADGTGVLKEKALENARELSRQLPKLNIYGDSELAQTAVDLATTLDGISAKALKSDAGKMAEVGETVTTATARLADKIAEMM